VEDSQIVLRIHLSSDQNRGLITAFARIPCIFPRGSRLVRVLQVEKMRGLAIDNLPKLYEISTTGVDQVFQYSRTRISLGN
jgi:hypothetical protein